MDWLSNFFVEEPFSIVIPIVIIIAVFIYAARRSHFKHLERIRQIEDRYTQQSTSKYYQ